MRIDLNERIEFCPGAGSAPRKRTRPAAADCGSRSQDPDPSHLQCGRLWSNKAARCLPGKDSPSAFSSSPQTLRSARSGSDIHFNAAAEFSIAQLPNRIFDGVGIAREHDRARAVIRCHRKTSVILLRQRMGILERQFGESHQPRPLARCTSLLRDR